MWLRGIALPDEVFLKEEKEKERKPNSESTCPVVRLSSEKTFSVFSAPAIPSSPLDSIVMIIGTIVDFTLEVQSVDRPYFRG